MQREGTCKWGGWEQQAVCAISWAAHTRPPHAPRSQILSLQFEFARMFLGFRSRWSTPDECTKSRPRSSWYRNTWQHERQAERACVSTRRGKRADGRTGSALAAAAAGRPALLPPPPWAAHLVVVVREVVVGLNHGVQVGLHQLKDDVDVLERAGVGRQQHVLDLHDVCAQRAGRPGVRRGGCLGGAGCRACVSSSLAPARPRTGPRLRAQALAAAAGPTAAVLASCRGAGVLRLARASSRCSRPRRLGFKNCRNSHAPRRPPAHLGASAGAAA